MPDNRIPVGSFSNRDFNNEVPVAAKQENKRTPKEKVTTGEVKTRERSTSSKMIDDYFKDDIKIIKKNIWENVIKPKIQEIMMAIFETIVYQGDTLPSRSRTSRGNTTYVEYDQYSSGRRASRDQNTPRRELAERKIRRSNDVDDIIFEDKVDADRVLIDLRALIDSQYKMATVADLMELAGITGTATDNKWGWKDLSMAKVRRVPDGYWLDLPRPIFLEDD